MNYYVLLAQTNYGDETKNKILYERVEPEAYDYDGCEISREFFLHDLTNTQFEFYGNPVLLKENEYLLLKELIQKGVSSHLFSDPFYNQELRGVRLSSINLMLISPIENEIKIEFKKVNIEF